MLGIARSPTARASARSSSPTTWADRGRQRPGAAGRPRPRAQRRLLERLDARRGRRWSTRATTWVDVDVTLEPDVVLLPNVQLHGRPTSAPAPSIGPDTTLRDTEVGAGASVVRTHVRRRGDRAARRPSARSPTCGRAPGSAAGAKVGTFVETKNADIGDGAKVPHLSYVGDATIGEGTNIGAGTIFANYDGVEQAPHHGRRPRAPVGSDTMLVAPVDGRRRRLHRGRLGRSPTTSPPGALAVRAGRSATSRAGWRAGGAGTRARREAAQAARGRRRADPSAPGDDGGVRDAMTRHQDAPSEKKPDALLRPGAPRAGRGGRRAARASSSTRRRAYDFANGEIYVRFEESVRGCDAFVIQSHTAPINKWIMEQLHHGRRAQAGLGQADHRRRAVLRLRPAGQEAPRPRADLGPPDGRPVQDRRRRPADDRRPAHRADPGLLRRPGRPPVRAAAARDYVDAAGRPRTVAVVSPDAGRVAVAERWSDASAARRWRSSTRPATRPAPNEVKANRVVGEVDGRTCVLVDDMIDTGGTIVKAAEALFEAGAADVDRRRDARRAVRPGGRPAEEQPGQRGHRDQHAADPDGAAVRQADRALDRPADRPRRSARSSTTAR